MINILHIDTGLTFRGGQRQVSLLLNNLQHLRIRQYLACPENSPLMDQTTYAVEKRFPLSKSNFMRFLERRELRRFIENYDINIIHAHDSHSHSLATLLAKRGAPRVMVTRRSSGKIGFGSRTKYTGHNIKFIAISNHIREQLVSGGVQSDQITVINSMIDLGRYDYFHRRQKVKPDLLRKTRIVSAGAFDRMKGYHDALKAIKIIAEKRSDFSYELYGDGPEKDRLLGDIKKYDLGEIVDLPGWRSEPSDYLKEADIFISTSYSEGLNMSIVEAMAAGAAVTATDLAPHRENVEHEKTGMLFAPGDCETLAANLMRLMDEHELRRTITQNAREISEKYDSHTISRQVFELYGEVVAGKL